MPALRYGDYRDRFHDWLLGKHCKSHAKTLISYAERYLPDVIEDQFKLKEIYGRAESGRRSLSMSIRNYLNFLEEFSLMDEESLERYRKTVKVPRTGTDDYVPETSEVLRAFASFDMADYRLVFRLLFYSGVRVVEAVELLARFDLSRTMVKGSMAKYPLSMNRETKKVLYAYVPAAFALELRQVSLSLNAVKMYFSGRGFPAKYLRKWQYNFLIENGVPESVCDFIQGRSLRGSVGGMHYLAKAKQSDHFYGVVVPKFPSLKDSPETR